MDGKGATNHGNSFSNGPRSAYNGNSPIPILHSWFCACHWCLNGHR